MSMKQAAAAPVDLILTFDLVLKDGQHTQGSAIGVESISVNDHPQVKGFNEPCDLAHVDRITLSDGRHVDLYWATKLFGPNGDKRLLTQEPQQAGLVVPFEGRPFICRTEPTLDGRVGIAIESERGKTLFVGTGDVVEGKGGLTREFISFGQAVYAWKHASPSGCAHTNWAKRK